MKTNKAIDELIAKDAEDRADLLRFWTEEQRTIALQAWAEDPRLTAMDVIALPEPHRTTMTRMVLDSGRIFCVQPAPEWKPPASMKDIPASFWETIKGVVYLPVRKAGEKNAHVRIDRPMQLPPDKALLALGLFGPTADLEINCGRLMEISEAEFYEAQSSRSKAKK